MSNEKVKKIPPSMDLWLREAKKDPAALQEGMFLIHNGVVRQTPKAKVRQGLDDGTLVKGMEFGYDEAKVDAVIAETLKMDGIFQVRVWLNEGQLELGDDIMYVLIGGDIRPHVVDALQFLVGKIKSECVTEIEKIFITVKTTVDAPVEKVWKCWTEPEHIIKWNAASEDWHTPFAENHLSPGGKFSYRMEAKDGSAGFDFSGVYTRVKEYEEIFYTMDDGRDAEIKFTSNGKLTTVMESFEAERENSIELQKSGWQSILDNFKKHAEVEFTWEN